MSSNCPPTEELLAGAPLFAGLSPSDFSKVTAIATMEHLEPSTVLFQEGSVCDRLYLVIEGLIALEMCTPRRGCTRILTIGPPDIVGVSALLKDSRMTARATAVEATTLMAFPARELREVCEADHDIGYAVMTQVAVAIASRLLATRLQLLDIFSETHPVVRRVP